MNYYNLNINKSFNATLCLSPPKIIILFSNYNHEWPVLAQGILPLINP